MFTLYLCNWLVASVVCLWTPQVGEAGAQTSAGKPGFVREMRYLDADRDHQIDAREFADGQQMASILLSLSWEECDRDSDGAISHGEFEAAANEATQALLATDTESDQEAENELAKLISMQVLLDRLDQDDQYADELAALREAVEDMDNDEAVVTHIVQNPTRYPHLTPVVRTWVRHYPVKPALRRNLKPYHPLSPKYRVKPAKSIKKPVGVKPAKPGKAGKKPGHKPGKPAGKPKRPRRP